MCYLEIFGHEEFGIYDENISMCPGPKIIFFNDGIFAVLSRYNPNPNNNKL